MKNLDGFNYNDQEKGDIVYSVNDNILNIHREDDN